MKPGINNFIDATLEEKIDLVCYQGSYIGVRKYYGYFINLYILEDVFYEVFYSPEENVIEKIEILDDQKKLNLYISFMNFLTQKIVKRLQKQY
jgi:hypothetical protein